MGFFDRLRGIDRRYWHVCYTCMTETGHDTVRAIFYSEGPPLLILGRPLIQCPRCAGNNTKSFEALKEEHAESQLWGLERVVRQNPRSKFIVKAEARPTEADRNIHELTTRQ